MPKMKWPKLNWSSIYKISLFEVVILFAILFFTYTMPLTVNKFSRSFFGKLLILLSVGLVAHYKIIYGLVLAVLFIVISEIGYMESFSDMDKKTGDDKKKTSDNKKKTSDKNKKTSDKKKQAGKEGMTGKDGLTTDQESKIAFIKDHCGDKKVTFDLETIQRDYTGLKFNAGVCDPCEPTCQYYIDNTSDSLYTYNKLVNPVDKQL